MAARPVLSDWLRQTEGLIGSIIRLLGLALAVPDHTPLCRRAETLEVPQLKRSGDARRAEPVHLLVDSTGLKLFGSGEWLLEKHGTKTRRSWRKMHIGVDTDTGQIAAAVLTDNDVDDSSQVGPLLDRDRTHTARQAPPTHGREGQVGMAEGLRIQQARSSRSDHRQVQEGDRGRAALTHRSAQGDRSGRCRPCFEPERPYSMAASYLQPFNSRQRNSPGFFHSRQSAIIALGCHHAPQPC